MSGFCSMSQMAKIMHMPLEKLQHLLNILKTDLHPHQEEVKQRLEEEVANQFGLSFTRTMDKAEKAAKEKRREELKKRIEQELCNEDQFGSRYGRSFKTLEHASLYRLRLCFNSSASNSKLVPFKSEATSVAIIASRRS
jgi:hypothetical protein